MSIFYWTENSAEYVSGDSGYEGKTVMVTERKGDVCEVKLGEKTRVDRNGSTVYKTQQNVANGSRRNAIRSLALQIAKKHSFGDYADEFGDIARKAYAEANNPELTPEQASDIIGNLKEKVKGLGRG